MPELLRSARQCNDCFLCRFDFGFSVGGVDAGVLGLLIIISSILCCCICYSICMFCFCFLSKNANNSSNNNSSSYTPIPTSVENSNVKWSLLLLDHSYGLLSIFTTGIEKTIIIKELFTTDFDCTLKSVTNSHISSLQQIQICHAFLACNLTQ